MIGTSKIYDFNRNINVERDLVMQEDVRPSTPVYQRYTTALQNDPRCSQEVALGRRIGFYRFCGDIGRGNFSRVKLAVHQLTKDKVAIKVVDTSRLDAKALRMLSREVTTLEAAFHPFILRFLLFVMGHFCRQNCLKHGHIIQLGWVGFDANSEFNRFQKTPLDEENKTENTLFEVIDTIGKIYLVSEWIPGGELYSRIVEIGALEENHAAIIFYQLLVAVKYLHNLGYVHRDIKAENILMVNEERIKLADFGFSTQLNNGSSQHLDTFCGSPPYAAPELFSDDHYVGGPVDVWALGVLLYFMLHAKMPFKGSTIPLLRTAVLKGEYEILTSFSLPCCRLIQRILVSSPMRRPTIDQQLNCQWFEYVQSSAFHTIQSNDVTGQGSDIGEVPNRRKNIFWLFSTSGQHRQCSLRSSKDTNVAAANQIQSINQPKSTVKCSTKRANSVLEEIFLRPLKEETNFKNPTTDSHADMNTSDNNNDSQKERKISFRRVIRKRVSPIEATKKHKSTPNTSNIKTQDFRNVLQNLVDEGHGNQVMYPSSNGQISPLESETRRLMEKLGISSGMLHKTMDKGPRSDILGIYRIIIHRLQKEQTIDCISSNENQSDYRYNRNFSKCTKNWESTGCRKPKKRNIKSVTCAIL